MDFLELCNRARQECGVSGADLATLQYGVSNEGRRFSNWINQAWNDLQMARPDWVWMRKEAIFQTILGQGDYSLTEAGADDLAEWKTDSFRSYPTAAGTPGEQHMEWIEYTRYRDMYQFSTMRTSPGFPLWLTTNPDHSLAVWPLPSDAYTIRGEYYRAPSVLAADTDSPLSGGLPVRFHMLLVYMAMQSYAFFAAAPEVETRATSQRNRILAKLDAWGLPTMEMAGPL